MFLLAVFHERYNVSLCVDGHRVMTHDHAVCLGFSRQLFLDEHKCYARGNSSSSSSSKQQWIRHQTSRALLLREVSISHSACSDNSSSSVVVAAAAAADTTLGTA